MEFGLDGSRDETTQFTLDNGDKYNGEGRCRQKSCAVRVHKTSAGTVLELVAFFWTAICHKMGRGQRMLFASASKNKVNRSQYDPIRAVARDEGALF